MTLNFDSLSSVDIAVDLDDTVVELQEGEIDLRIKNLSYSSLLTLHACPRKYQLYKLQSKDLTVKEDVSSNVTFAYGHVVGEAIQDTLQDKSESEILMKLFLGWHADLLDSNTKQNKSIWTAIHAVNKFRFLRANGLLKDYELVYYDGKPAVEFSFSITFPDGFIYRGYVDAVLRHRITGEVVVLECKTTSATSVNPATYKNSAQAIGYSIVLDHLFPDLSSYKIYYLVYLTKTQEYEIYPFDKSYLQRALWIQELLLDIEIIKLYENTGVYPMHGESCLDFYKECEYMNICTLGTDKIAKPLTQKTVEKITEEHKTYQIQLSLSDLIESQLSKV